MINKYKVNQIVLSTNLLCFFILQFWLYSKESLLDWYTVPALFVIVINLHYFLNVLHLATHNLMSKKRWANNYMGRISAILGGLTFAEFSKTHLQHHLHPADSSKDPDYLLTKSGSLLTLPFRIWVKDIYFWKTKFLSTPSYSKMYIQDRLVQIIILVSILFFGKISHFLFFWSLPSLLVGFSYGFYLFYFPHYISKWEKRARLVEVSQLQNSSLAGKFIFDKIILWSIDLSRFYHAQHHFKIQDNLNYYPLLAYIKDVLSNKLSPKFATEKTFTVEK